MDEVISCVVCQSCQDDDSNYLNTKMKLLISKCGHRFCDHCIKREFQYKKEIECPSCKKSVKKNQLQDKTLEELSYTKELSIRKKVTKDYNKTEDDFGTLEAFNDYLEHMEDLIYDLVHGDEKLRKERQAEWKSYRQDHLNQIATNDARKAEDERRLIQLLESRERAKEQQRVLQYQEDHMRDSELKIQTKQLMEVALGEREAEDVIQVHTTTTAVPIDEPINEQMQAAMMGFQPGVFSGPQPQPVVGGKKGLALNANAESKEGRKLQQMAGGYDPSLSFQRNKLEAWMGVQLQTSF